MSSYQVGTEIISHCSKCKLALAHTIATLKNEKTVHKVVCNTCKHTHVYKDPKKVKKKRATRRSAKAEQTHEEVYKTALNEANSKAQEYSIKGKFYKGDLINHPTFGDGVIDKTLDDNKIQVIFQDEVRTLVHNLK